MKAQQYANAGAEMRFRLTEVPSRLSYVKLQPLALSEVNRD